MRPPGTVSLERALSKLGLASRTQARALVVAGQVSVNGRVVTDPAVPVVPERVRLAVGGRRVSRPGPLTLLLHKPRGVVTTARDPGGRPTVLDLVADAPARVVPVGRLDLATSGLLLLTNDTRLGDWITDPANAVPRTYVVTVRGAVTDAEADRMRAGLDPAEEGPGPSSVGVEVRKRSGRETHLVFTLTEGRNREIRRLCDAVGHEVTRLKRVAFGGLELGSLPPGAWRVVTPEELRKAFPGYVTTGRP